MEQLDFNDVFKELWTDKLKQQIFHLRNKIIYLYKLTVTDYDAHYDPSTVWQE